MSSLFFKIRRSNNTRPIHQEIETEATHVPEANQTYNRITIAHLTWCRPKQPDSFQTTAGLFFIGIDRVQRLQRFAGRWLSSTLESIGS